MNCNCPDNLSLNDQERMEDMLAQEKYLITAYSTFIPEAACPELRQVLNANFNGCVNNQQEIFDKMSQFGWYPTKAASQPEIDTARQKFQQMKQQLG